MQATKTRNDFHTIAEEDCSPDLALAVATGTNAAVVLLDACSPAPCSNRLDETTTGGPLWHVQT